MKKIISSLAAAAMAASLLPTVYAEPAVTAESSGEVNNAVSGYVSTTSGNITLASGNYTMPVIYVDDNDYTGVIRAANDLKEDLEAVTGRKPVVTSDLNTQQIVGSGGFHIGEHGMSIDFPAPFDYNGEDAYAAAYDKNGALTGIVKAQKPLVAEGQGVSWFDFDKVLEVPEGGSAKAFVWKGMEPVMPVYDYVPYSLLSDYDVTVFAGTIGKSDIIDLLIKSGELDVSEIENKWESFTIQDISGKLVIAGSDMRGTIYGIYDLCEKIGVSPWSFWADTQPAHADELYVNLPKEGYTEGEPSVQYRGIFLNDEFNMSEWSKSMGDTGVNMNNATYEKLFELLLRLKANYLWPAMHTYSTAFNVTENNAALANEYGIVMGSSHCEPLLRNNLGELYSYQQEWIAAHPDKKLYINTTDDAKHSVSYMWTDKDASGNAVDNKEFLTDYWRARAAANGGYENTYTLGMRGVHDGKFSTNMNSKTAMTEIIAAQTQILKDEVAKDGDIADVPQVFIPYKEMLDLYNQGLNIPEYVTLMWPDDNFGYIRQFPTAEERNRSGGAGVYYHLSYFGRPTSYLWLGTTQPGLIREEMTKAYDTGAQKIWVANVGDLKPAETETEYFLDLARDVEGMRNKDIGEWLSENAKRDFNLDDASASEYAEVKKDYYELANSRRPEHMTNALLALEKYDEAQTTLDRYDEMESRAQAIYDGLPEERKPSMYELLLYPVKGAANMARKYIYNDKAQYFADNSLGSAANKYAAMSDAAQDAIVSATNEYTTMLGGKWDKMMNPFQTQLKGSFGGPISGKLTQPGVTDVGYGDMVVIVRNNYDQRNDRMDLTRYTTEPCPIDIINPGKGAFKWSAETDRDWITINKTSGTVYDDDRIYVGFDISKLESGSDFGDVTIKQYVGDTVIKTCRIAVNVRDNEMGEAPYESYYVMEKGAVSIEAEHYSSSVTNGEYEWKTEKDFGRSGDSVKLYPDKANAVLSPGKDGGAYLEYNVYFDKDGSLPIDVYRMPTINELAGSTMNFAVGIDDGQPVTFKGNTKTTDNSTGADAWGKGVLWNTEVCSGKISVTKGWHTIRLYGISTGVVIDKLVIGCGTPKPYFGMPESYHSIYNNTMKPLPKSHEDGTAQTGTLTSLFDPSLRLVSDAGAENVEIVKLAEVDKAMLVNAYFNNGVMIGADFADVDLSNTSVNGKKTLEYAKTVDTSAYSEYTIVTMLLSPDYKPLAPYLEHDVLKGVAAQAIDYSSASLAAAYEDGYAYPAANISSYKGRQAVCVIADQDSADTDGIKYIRQYTIGENTFKRIEFPHQGMFDLTMQISNIDEPIKERLSTIINIQPDTEPVSTVIYSQPFDGEPGDGVISISGGSAYDSVNKAVKMASSAAAGTLSADFASPVTMLQGDKITVVSKIAYGKLSGKYLDYSVNDSNGKSIVSSHISAYCTGDQNIKIGGRAVFEANSSLPAAIARNNSALSAGYTTYTTVIDVSKNEVTLTVNSTGGTEVYTGKLPDGTSYDIKSITFNSSYTNTDRSCYVDDISITKESGAGYTMSLVPVTADGAAVTNAAITVADAVTGTVVAPVAGKYILCDGVYNCTVTADGYKDVEAQLEVSPATESKEIKVMMEEGTTVRIPASITVEFKDSDGGTIMEDMTVEGNYYVGGSYSVPAQYQKNIVVRSDGMAYTYRYMPERSTPEITSLAENNVLTMVYNMENTFSYYEDYESYDVAEHNWSAGSAGMKPEVYEENGSKYLKYTSNGNTHGAVEKIDVIDCEGMEVTIEADLRFAPTGTAGNSQFTIGSDAPTFSGDKTDWGIIDSSAGHILAFEFNQGTAFKVNKQTVSTNFIGSWMHVKAVADFNIKTVNVTLTSENGASAEFNDLPFFSSDTIKNIGSIYVRAAKANGTVCVDNLTMTSQVSSNMPVIPDTPLYEKNVYAFGDSIVYGHTAPAQSFMSLIKSECGIGLTMMAKNGATVISSGNHILTQVKNAPSAEPDIVIFDGYTNDAYEGVLENMGVIQGMDATTFDNTTFCGAFEETLYTMKQKWPDAKIVFITIHKSGGRDFDIQTGLVDATLEMCEAWGVEVVDMFHDSTLDTRNADEMSKYIMGGAGSHPNVAACREFYIPAVKAKLESFYE